MDGKSRIGLRKGAKSLRMFSTADLVSDFPPWTSPLVAGFCEAGVRRSERWPLNGVGKHERQSSTWDLATFLARRISRFRENRGPYLQMILGRFYNEIQHSLRKSLTLSSQALERKNAIW